MRLTFPLLFLLGIGLLGFTACGDDDDVPNNPIIGTITDIVNGQTDLDVDESNFTTLAAALERTGLDITLDVPTSRFTVFAPTNQAFANSGIDLASLSDEELTDILAYHVATDVLLEGQDIESGRSFANSANTEGPDGTSVPLIIDNDGSTIRLRDMANVTEADIVAVNGIIHVIDNVLIPPTLVDRAVLDGRFSTLLTALERVGLDDVLMEDAEGGGDYTVFAPTDDALAASGLNLDLVTDETLTDLLLYHVLGTGVRAENIPDGQSFQTTLSTAGPDTSNLSLLIEASGDGVVLNDDATVVVADVIATNGVIHAIDEVLALQDIVDFVNNANAVSQLDTALTDAGLVNSLMGEGPYTVFAPIDAAFEAAADTLATLSADQVSNVLLYHVIVGSNVRSSALMNDMDITTTGDFNDSPFSISIEVDADGNSLPPVLVTPDGTRVNFVMTDIQATNGVIHLVDQILLPDLD